MTQTNRIENDPEFVVKGGDKKFNQTYRQLYFEFQDITRLVAKENNIMLIDLSREIKGSEKYVYDSVHLNNEGSKVVSEFIADKLQKTVVNFKRK